MAQFQITLSDDILHDLFVGDGVARLLEETLNQVLQAQITEYLRAEPYERTSERQGQRNGYKPRTFNTRVGTLNLAIPQTRDGRFSTELFARYQRSEKALVLALMEMVGRRRLHPQGAAHHRGTVRDELFEVHRLSSLRAAGRCGPGLEQPGSQWSALPLCDCRRPDAQDPS